MAHFFLSKTAAIYLHQNSQKSHSSKVVFSYLPTQNKFFYPRTPIKYILKIYFSTSLLSLHSWIKLSETENISFDPFAPE